MKLRLTPTEHDEQVRVIDWCAVHEGQRPELANIFAIPNAGAGAQKGQAGKMKAEGVKPGVPDLFLAVPRGGRFGLFIEMKAMGGKASIEQAGWIARLTMFGYDARICYGADEAIAAIEDYIK